MYQEIMEKSYIFKSERLGFRNWSKSDLKEFAKLNSDPDVMAYFPRPLSTKETEDFIDRLQKHYYKRGYTYFATEILATGQLIGFIGLAYQSYETEFTPSIDIGWRLRKSSWGNGFATEGAKRCIEYAFNNLKIQRLVATCTIRNIKSETIMQKIGMARGSHFKHPKLKDSPEYEDCVWYEIENNKLGLKKISN